MLRAVWNRFKKRQAGVQLDTAWPFGATAPIYGGVENIPAIRRCISLYSTFLSILDLETEDEKPDHYFIKLLERPHPMFSKTAFYEALIKEFLLNGQFVARLIYNRQTGKIERIDPYLNRSARGYVRSGDYNDPVAIAEGVYYRSTYSSKVWFPDECLHIKDGFLSSADQVNAYPRTYYFKTLFDTGIAVQNVTLGLSLSGGRGAVLIEGLPMSNAEKDREIREQFQRVLQAGLKETTSQVAGMPMGYKPHPLLPQSGHSMMQWLAERTDLEICKIFSVPYEFLLTGKAGVQNLKEITRFWLRTTLRSVTSKISHAFSQAVNDGTKFVFRVGKLRFSDQREAANYYSALLDQGVLSPEEVKEYLEEKL